LLSADLTSNPAYKIKSELKNIFAFVFIHSGNNRKDHVFSMFAVTKVFSMYRTELLFFFLLFVCCLSVKGQSRNLQYFIERAQENSPLIKDYRNRSAAAQIDSQLIRANYQPQVTGNSNNSYAPVIRGFGYEQAVTNGGGLNAVVAVNQAFASKKKLDAQFRSIRIQRQGIENASAISVQDLKKTITDQYITAYGTLQQLNFTRQINQLLSKEEVILKRLTEKNVYRQTDYLTFLVTLQQQELTAKQQQIQFQNDYATLNYLAGLYDTSAVVLDDPGLVINELQPPENSIFFRQFTLDSLNLVNDKLLLDLSYKPKLGVYGDAGYNSTLAYSPFKNFGTSIGVNLNLPIYDGKKRKLQHTKLDINQFTATGYRNFAKSQYYQQVSRLKQQYALTEDLISQINSQIKYSESLIKVNSRLLETGDARIADLVIALNNYLTAKNLLTQNTVSRLQIINQINYWNR
jgi:outer membrane protein TolC